jgi:hypothetical protein
LANPKTRSTCLLGSRIRIQWPHLLTHLSRSSREQSKPFFPCTSLDEDWSDVEVDLPALIARRGHRNRDEETRWFADARKVIGIGSLHGMISEGLIDAIDPVSERSDQYGATNHGSLLRIVLGDLGIRVVDDADFPEEAAELDEEAEGQLESSVAEGMAFLRSLIGPGSDPLDQYFKELSRAKPISREEEGTIAERMEQGMLHAFTALTRSAPGMAKIMATLDAIEHGSISWRDAFAEDPVGSRRRRWPDAGQHRSRRPRSALGQAMRSTSSMASARAGVSAVAGCSRYCFFSGACSARSSFASIVS